MPEEKAARRTNAALPTPEHVAEPGTFEWEGATFYSCPFCGANGEELERIQSHIDSVHAGQTLEGGGEK